MTTLTDGEWKPLISAALMLARTANENIEGCCLFTDEIESFFTHRISSTVAIADAGLNCKQKVLKALVSLTFHIQFAYVRIMLTERNYELFSNPVRRTTMAGYCEDGMLRNESYLR